VDEFLTKIASFALHYPEMKIFQTHRGPAVSYHNDHRIIIIIDIIIVVSLYPLFKPLIALLRGIK
jgi:hypothetical protein